LRGDGFSSGVVSKGEKKIGMHFQGMSNTVPCFKEIL
jgi:hypothetical protein